MSVLANVLRQASEPQYDPYKGWDVVAQPLADLDPKDYHYLSTEAEPILKLQLKDFLTENHLTFVEIPLIDFQQEYETKTINFRDWFEDYCARKGLNPHASVAVVGPRVKELDSATRKETLRLADRTKDSLAIMMIFLQGQTAKSVKQSVERMGDSIVAIENDIRTVAQKNLFHSPKANGYRGHKAIWVTPLPQNHALQDVKVLSEVKIEHESQQDLNRVTRKFMGIQRNAQGILPQFFARCASEGMHSARNASSNYSRTDHKVAVLTEFSRYIYDLVHHEAGLNHLLAGNKKAAHTPVDQNVLYNAGKKVTETFGPMICNALDNAGIHIPKLKAFLERQEFLMK